jgi:hypothetical protein
LTGTKFGIRRDCGAAFSGFHLPTAERTAG